MGPTRTAGRIWSLSVGLSMLSRGIQVTTMQQNVEHGRVIIDMDKFGRISMLSCLCSDIVKLMSCRSLEMMFAIAIIDKALHTNGNPTILSSSVQRMVVLAKKVAHLLVRHTIRGCFCDVEPV